MRKNKDLFLAINTCKTPTGPFVSVFSDDKYPGMTVDKGVDRVVYKIDNNMVNSFFKTLRANKMLFIKHQLKYGIVFNGGYVKDLRRMQKFIDLVKNFSVKCLPS